MTGLKLGGSSAMAKVTTASCISVEDVGDACGDEVVAVMPSEGAGLQLTRLTRQMAAKITSVTILKSLLWDIFPPCSSSRKQDKPQWFYTLAIV
jgi:hypothetical protein